MSFSWLALTGMDIGVLSINLIGLWVLKKWVDKRLEAQKEAQKMEYNSLKAEFKAFQSASDQRYAALQKENKFLRKEVARQADEIDELKQAFYGLKGRYDELKELLNRLIAKL